MRTQLLTFNDHWTYPPAMLKLSILYNTHISILTLSILRNTQLEYKMLSIYNTQLVFCIIWNPYFKYGIHISKYGIHIDFNMM